MTREALFPCSKCRAGTVFLDWTHPARMNCNACDWFGYWPDHPYTDPGDGRTQCAVCGKWVWLVTHSCKGIRVAPPQFRVIEGGDIDPNEDAP